MRAEVVVLLAAAGVLLVIGAFGYIITETEIVAGDPPETPQLIQPYLPAGMTSVALGLIILVVAVVAAVAMRSR